MKQIIVFLFLFMPYFMANSQSVDLKKGLVAYYPFNGNANDESGNGNNGRVSGATLTTDKSEKNNCAYYFNGNAYITVPDKGSLNFSTSFSIFAWVNIENVYNNQKIICKAYPNRFEGGYILGIDKNQVYPEIFDELNNHFGGKNGESIQSNTWTFIGVTLDNNTLKYYANGKSIFELPVTASSMQRNNNDLIIGSNSWEKPPKNLMTRGKIDEIRIYNRALNQNEITQLYDSQNQEIISAPVISWENPSANYINSIDAFYNIKACIKTKKPLNSLKVFVNNQLYSDPSSGRGMNVVPANLCDASIEMQILLNEGNNEIKIVAVNAGGTTISETRNIVYQSVKQDITGPAITLIQPRGQRGFKMITEAEQINVSGKASDESGISNITVNNLNVNFSNDGTFQTSVNLNGGDNSITIKATNKKQNSSEFTFFVQNESRKVIINPVATNEKRFALIIGNGAYPSAPLKNPVNDATLITQEIKKLGFETTTITDGSQNQIKEAISKFGDLLGTDKNAIGLFYYAGHGIQAKGKNYLIPVDAKIEKEADLVVYCVDLDALLANMEYAGNNLNMIILDACRNNPFGRGFRSAAGNGLATINAPSGTIIAFATAPGSTAADGEGNNGLYTQEFVKVVQTPNLKIEDVFKKVRTQVKALSEGKQIPWENSALEGDFYFRKQ